MAGFVSSGTAPFHFGASRPSSVPPPRLPPGLGLPLLAKPDLESARLVWLKQLDRLASLPGTDAALLASVRGWVTDGISSVFKDGPPPPAQYSNTKTFNDNLDVCMERLKVYRELGALKHLSDPPPPGGYSYVQPLHAIIKSGKKARICVDMSRNFNDFTEDCPFRYSSVQSGVDLALQCPTAAYFVKLDISSCFLSFPLHPDDYKFFVVQAGGDFWQFVRLVFGLKNAPYVATLLLDVVSSALDDAGIEHTRYLDDFLIVGTTAQKAWESARVAVTIIKPFGLALAPDKIEGPLQRIEFLGIVLDSVAQTLSISAERHAELVTLLKDFATRRWSSLKRVQSLLGKLNFAATVLPGARPFMRRIIDTIAGRTSGRVRLDDSFQSDVRYWLAHVSAWNGRASWRRSEEDPFVFASDASVSGFAYGLETARSGVEFPPPLQPGAVRCGLWSASNGDAARQHTSSAIQWGEFFGPLAAAVEYGAWLADAHVVFVIDNEADVAIINRLRTREPRLCALLRSLCDVALSHNFSFAAVHRSGVDNVLMDWASRPNLHKFSARPSDVPTPVASVAGALCGGGGDFGVASRFPPMLYPLTLTYTNSRCLQFETTGEKVRWTPASAVWSTSAAPWR